MLISITQHHIDQFVLGTGVVPITHTYIIDLIFVDKLATCATGSCISVLGVRVCDVVLRCGSDGEGTTFDEVVDLCEAN